MLGFYLTFLTVKDNFKIFQDLEVQYEDYSQLLQSVDQALDDAESRLPTTVDLDDVKCPDLVAQLNQTQVTVYTTLLYLSR